MDIRVFIPVFLVGIVLAIRSVDAERYEPSYLPPKCKPCDARTCPILTFCAGGIKVKDHCGCCSRCSSDLFQPHVNLPAAKTKGNVCEQVECDRFKVCMVNIQGLPLCMCPSAYICRTRKSRKRKVQDVSVCGSNGVTYENRCMLRIADCNNPKRIKVASKGSCGNNGLVIQDSDITTTSGVTRKVNTVEKEQRMEEIVRNIKKKGGRRRNRRRRQRRHNKNGGLKGRKYRKMRDRKNRKARRNLRNLRY